MAVFFTTFPINDDQPTQSTTSYNAPTTTEYAKIDARKELN
jgi:hypothetical protein